MLNNVNNHRQLGAQTLRETDGDCLVLNKQLTSHFVSENGKREREIKKTVARDVRFQ